MKNVQFLQYWQVECSSDEETARIQKCPDPKIYRQEVLSKQQFAQLSAKKAQPPRAIVPQLNFLAESSDREVQVVSDVNRPSKQNSLQRLQQALNTCEKTDRATRTVQTKSAAIESNLQQQCFTESGSSHVFIHDNTSIKPVEEPQMLL